MAKFDMIANHKRGFFNSTVGNAFRGSLTGGLVFGGIAALATIATGGLALPLVAAAAGAGAALFGTVNAGVGAVRWGAETVGGVIGVNRPQRNRAQDEYGMENEKQGMGMAELAVTAVGAIMGLGSMKNKLANWAGHPGEGDKIGRGSRDTGRGSANRGVSNKELMMPSILAEKMHDGKLRLTQDDLANPDLRNAMDSYGKQLGNDSMALAKAGDPRFKQINQRATEAYGHNPDAEMWEVNPEHLMVKGVRNEMLSAGEVRQQDNIQAQKDFARGATQDAKDLTRGRVEPERYNPAARDAEPVVENTRPIERPVEAAMPERQPAQAAPEVAKPQVAQQAADPLKDMPALKAAGFEMPGAGAMERAKQASQKAASTLQNSGVEHRGNTENVRSASVPNNAQGRGQSQGPSHG